MSRRHRNKTRKPEDRFDPDQRWIVPGVCVFLVAITWLVFGQTLGHDFIRFDDHKYVYENPQVSGGLSVGGVLWAFTNSHASNWHPLTFISHMLDCQLFSLKPGGHHFTNVFLHSLAVVFLFLFLRQSTGAIWRSGFVAALFAIHPLHVESVAWVAERKDVLSGLFFMLTLGAYARYVSKPTTGRYFAVTILFACGLMAKPMLVTLPAVLFLLDYWPLKRQLPIRRLILEKLPLLLLSAGSGLATLLAQTRVLSSSEDLSLWMRISNAAVSCVTYVWKSIWPTKLAVFYPHPFDQIPVGIVLFSIAFITGISVVAVMLRRNRGYVFVGWFWYLVMLVPVIGIVQVGLQSHADRYTYLPQIGLGILVTWGIVDIAQRWRYRRQILGVLAMITISALAWHAHGQTRFWRDNETLWRHALAVTERNYLAHANIAEIMMSRDRLHEAIEHFQMALAIRPDNADAHDKLGLLLLRVGDPSRAIAHWKMALEVEPHDLNAQSNLAWVFATCPESSMRDGRRAVAMMQDVIQRSETRNPILLRTLAAAYAESGRFSEAVKATQEALQVALDQRNAALAADLRRSLTNYEMDLPFRDPSLANARPMPELRLER